VKTTMSSTTERGGACDNVGQLTGRGDLAEKVGAGKGGT